MLKEDGSLVEMRAEHHELLLIGREFSHKTHSWTSQSMTCG